MQITRPTYSEILDNLYNSVKAQTPFYANLDDSGLGVVLKSAAAELDRLYAQLEDLANQSELTTASGTGLDKIGDRIGVLRNSAQKASSLGYSKPVRFTNLGVSSILIPSGTRVWNSTSPQIAFFTNEGITISGGSSGEVHVTASEVGNIFNVPRGYLNQHSVGTGNLTVTNILPIQDGSYRESDDSYRSRLINAHRARVTFNKQVCESLVRGVPSVKDVIIEEFVRGPGTFDVIVVPYYIDNISQTLSAVETVLQTYVDIAKDYSVRSPEFRYLDLTLSLKFNSANAPKQSIRAEVTAQITAVVDSLDVEIGNGEGTLYLNQLKGIALSSDSTISDVNLQVGLDGVPVSSSGELKVKSGEKIVLRSISVV